MKSASLQIELFVKDIDTSVDFYGRVLGFTIEKQKEGGYTPMHSGSVRFALNRRSNLPPDHPIHIAGGERPGRGVEFAIYVDDLRGIYARVQEQGWPISQGIVRQPWGLEDFRVLDPDGYYLRFTTVE
jgi:catechol 2,3-dioxygenase-like lactoylglutathione lyase family enzyme